MVVRPILLCRAFLLLLLLLLLLASPTSQQQQQEQEMTVTEALYHGVDLHGRGDFAAAVEVYSSVIGVAPMNADAFHLLGVALHASLKDEATLEAVAAATATASATATAARVGGSVAAAAPSSSSSSSSLSPVALLLRGGETLVYDEAVRHIRRALELAPSRLDVATNLGEVLRSGGDLEAAATLLRSVVATDQ